MVPFGKSEVTGVVWDDFEIDFKLNNQDVLKPNIIDEATINLKKIF